MERLLGAVYSSSSTYTPSTYKSTYVYVPTYISNYYYVPTYYSGYSNSGVYVYSYYYNPVVRIVGSIVGGLVFILILSLLICLHQRCCCFKNWRRDNATV